MTDTHDPSRAAWVEPASTLRLRWGGYRPRWIVGLALIIVGTGFIQLTSAYSLPLLLIGSLTHALGWVVQPTAVWRRVLVLLPALGTSWLLLGGPSFAGFFVVPLLCWLLIRYRPLLTWTVAIIPIVVGFVLGGLLFYYSQSWISLITESLVCVLSAWIARAFAQALARRQYRADTVHSVSRQADKLG